MAGAAGGGEERRQCRGEGPLGRTQGRLRGGLGQERGGGACLGSSVGMVSGRARRGGVEGEARSAVVYQGSLTVPRAEAAGTLGAAGSLGMMLGTGACVQPTLLVHHLFAVPGLCRPGLRTRHPARGYSSGVRSQLCCVVLCCAVLCCAVLCCVVLCCVALCRIVLCCVLFCCVALCCIVLCRAVMCVVLCCVVVCHVALCHVVLCCVMLFCVVFCCVALCCVVPKALVPNGKRPGCLPMGKGKRAGLCVRCARCV